MINLSNVLVNRKGSGYIWAITIVLALVIVFSGISEYLRMQMIVGGVRDRFTVSGHFCSDCKL